MIRRIYIAAASKEIERAERVRDQLRSHGFPIMSTWMEQIRQIGVANPRDASHAQRRKWSLQCLYEVSNSDVLLFLVPPEGIDTADAWGELIHAHNRPDIDILCAGDTKRSIFCALGQEFTNDDDAVLHISWMP